MNDLKEKLLKLVDEYGNACLKAGQSNSGYCIDPTASYEWERMQKLRCELRVGIQKLDASDSPSPTEAR